MNKYANAFFRVYDRKLLSGEIKFSQLGITKDDFTRLCTEPDFCFDEEKTRDLCVRMKLNEEESRNLMEACGKSRD
ncbi:MAG: hypothetical protein ACI4LO_04880 [Anaerovoracaceae bacterium]